MKLIFTLGIPGSGKSTYMQDKYPVVVTDELRKELLGDVNDITQEKFIFDTAIDRIVSLCYFHEVVYFDATMVETKHRVTMLEKIEGRVSDIEFVAIIFPADVELSKKRIAVDLEAGKDRADVTRMLEEYLEYYVETMDLIEFGKVKFTLDRR